MFKYTFEDFKKWFETSFEEAKKKGCFWCIDRRTRENYPLTERILMLGIHPDSLCQLSTPLGFSLHYDESRGISTRTCGVDPEEFLLAVKFLIELQALPKKMKEEKCW